MKQILSIISLFFVINCLFAENVKTINLTTPGTLSSILTSEEKSNVTNLTITGEINSDDFYVMRNMSALKILNLTNSIITISNGNGTNTPSNRIPQNAFKNNFSLTSIGLPKSLTIIGASAFSYCNYLQSISFPETLTTIEDNAFFYCPELTSNIKIPSSITSIGESAFSNGCGNFEVSSDNLYFSSFEGVLFNKQKTILIQCPSTKNGKYNIPPSVIKLASYSFYLCNQLTQVSIPTSLTTLEHHSFYACKNLESIEIPSTVSSIGSYAFMGVKGPFQVSDKNPLYSSINGILYNNSKSELIQCPTSISGEVNIPNSVKDINGLAFSQCQELTNITIPSSVVSIGQFAFSNCKNLKTIIIPNQVKDINNSTFSNCKNLTTITLPKNLETIGNNAFTFSGITSLTIPVTVKSIGRTPFYDCKKLMSIYVNSPNPLELHPSNAVFLTLDMSNCTLHVPFETKALYEKADQWKEFENIIELSTNITSNKLEEIKFIINNGLLTVSNANLGGHIEIFNISGNKVYDKRIFSSCEYISLKKGIYIIRINNYCKKVLVQ